MNLSNKTPLIASIILIGTFSLPTLAIDGLSANISATNNYLWRGVTQTYNNAAVSGGIDYEHKSGFSLGSWTSNANWADNMSYETDFYANYSHTINEQFSYSLGYIYYGYDSAAHVDFSEIYASLSYKNISLTYNTLVDSDSSGRFGDDTYLSIDADFAVAKELTLILHLGNYQFENADNYSDYAISLAKDEFTLTLSDTTISGSDGDLNIQISYTKSFNL